MSFEFHKGLFEFDLIDHHAVLGMPIDASAKEIRKRYLGIARRLHPDICKADDKQKAEALLSKLVNPAYKKLSNDRERDEYIVVLKMAGKRLLQEQQSISLKSDLAKQLAKANGLEQTYKTLMANLAQKQYEDLNQTLETISDISELNLVYVLRKEREGKGVRREQRPASRPPVTPPPPPPTGGQAKPGNAYVEKYYRRAESLMANKNLQSLTMARKELQDALKLEPNSSRVHALMGLVYLQQNELKPSSVNITLAKKHVTQALKLDTKEPMALEARKKLNHLIANSPGKSQTSGAKAPPKGKSDKSGGGLFGGLFGGKKKS